MMITSERVAGAGVQVRDRLRIAIQKSGRLSEPARELLARAGLSFRESRDRLFCYGETLPIDLLLVRDDDIPALIADGVCDLGIVGLNVLSEQAEDRRRRGMDPGVRAYRELGASRCRLSVAVPQAWDFSGPEALSGKRIATSYPRLLERWLEEQGVRAEVVVLSGSVEIAPRLGTAEAICDLVSTGGTLAANQLREVAVVIESQAVLAGPDGGFAGERAALAELLQRRLDDVLRARSSRLLMFQAPRAALERLLHLLPDADPPTVTRLDGGSDEIALQAICREAMTWQRLEEMKRAGARGLLVLPVDQMLA